MKPGRFEGGPEKKREKSGLQEAWGEPPRTGAMRERVRQPTPEGENEKPGADQKKEGAKKKQRFFPAQESGKEIRWERKLGGEDGGVTLDEELDCSAAEEDGGGEVGPGASGVLGKEGEAVDRACPEGSGEQQVAGFGGGADLVGKPVQGGKSIDRAENLSERVVFETAGEGEEGEDEGLQGAEGSVGDRLLGKDFHVARDVGSESAGIEEVSGEEESGFEGLTPRALGGEKGGLRRKGDGIEKGLDAR